MKKYFFLLIPLTGFHASAQVSVYSCQGNAQVTQAMIDAATSIYRQQCIDFPTTQAFLFSGSTNKEVRATQEIKVEPGFTTGAFTGSGQLKLSVVPQTGFDVAVMNYPDLLTIQKLEKFELGVALPTDIAAKVRNFVLKVPNTQQINPFLDWELDVEATFTHVATGTIKKVDGFYYREYQRNLSSSTWDEIATNYSMRIRFSPPLTGQWICIISIKVNTTEVSQSAEFPFNVVNSSNPGYVTVHQNQRNLEQNGRIIFPVGVNFDGPIKDVVNNHSGPANQPDLFHPEDIDITTTPQNWVTYHNDIITYKNQGGRFIRTLQNPWGALIEFQEKGNYYNRMHYAWEQDRLIDYCEANDILIHFNLMHQEPMMIYGNYSLYDWDWSHYNSDGTYFAADIFPAYCYANGDQKQPYEMFTLETDLKYHEQRIRYYISRYGYSTSIYLFELLSEPWHLNERSGQTEPFQQNTALGANVRSAVQNYHERMSSYIKQTLGHREHLVGIDVFTATIFNSTSYLDESIDHPDIDVISFNPYASAPSKLINTKSDDVSLNNVLESDENSMYAVVKKIQDIAHKPIMIAEGGAGDGVDDCSNFAQQYVDVTTFGFTGIAGFNSWIGGFNGQDITWQTTINAQNHMNGYDVINTLSNSVGDWIQGRQKTNYLSNQEHEDSKEQQYYISKNQEMAVGYVKNRTFNAYTARTTNDANSKCVQLGSSLQPILQDFNNIEWDRQKLTIGGLKYNTNYLIHWFSFKNGYYMSSSCFNTSFQGRADIHHPQLYVHPDAIAAGNPLSAVLWYVIEQNNCQNGLVSSTVVPEMELTPENIRVEQTTGMDNSFLKFDIFPNPVQNELMIQSSEPIGRFTLTNSLNQIMREQLTDEKSFVLDVNGLAKGTYILHFYANDVIYKFIKL